MSNVSPQNFEYKLVNPTKLSDTEHDEFNGLYRASVEVDFPGRSQAEYDYFINNLEKQRRKVNAGVGGPFQRKNQRYGSPLAAVILDRSHNLHGVISGTVNVSTSAEEKLTDRVGAKLGKKAGKVVGLVVGKPLGKLEMAAKMHSDTLHINRLVPKKWASLGSRAFSLSLLEGIQDTGDVSAADVGVHHILEKRDPREQVSSWPYVGERLWSPYLTSIGVTYTGEPFEWRWVFGEDATPVVQFRHTNSGVHEVLDIISQKPGAPEAIDQSK
ncbi:MAG TPA: hypothetical protein VLF90_03260 [Patescibacteria group bacterium]|nr:hypothetical protein [Patescibacteria group bacterium]